MNKQLITQNILEQVTDISACLSSPDKSIQFPGPVKLDESLRDYVQNLSQSFKELQVVDGTLELLGYSWRGHMDKRVVDGTWIRFRKMPATSPNLESLPTRLPEAVFKFLVDHKLSDGGLVLIAGPAGSGKTTTASASVVTRLMLHEGFCLTVEDPPENPLNGWHGKGYCSQTWVQVQGATPWGDALKGVLRSQPVGTPSMLFVGEVREDEAARVALQAAGNGFLVICTSFATDMTSAVQSFGDRLDKSQLEAFGKLLKGVVFQKLEGKFLQVHLLESNLSLQQMIAQGKYQSIAGETQRQANERLYMNKSASTSTVAAPHRIANPMGLSISG